MEKTSVSYVSTQKAVIDYFGLNADTISDLSIKFAAAAFKEQNICGATTIEKTFAAGGENYRLKIIGAYNDLQNGGTKKTDYCFAHITIEIKGYNGRYTSFGSIWVKENGISVATFADRVYDGILDCYWDNLRVEATYNDYAKEVVAKTNVYFEVGVAILVGKHKNIIDCVPETEYKADPSFFHTIWTYLLADCVA